MTEQSHAILNLLTALAYFSIPFSLLVYLKKRKSKEFTWVFICFIMFIMLCGLIALYAYYRISLSNPFKSYD